MKSHDNIAIEFRKGDVKAFEKIFRLHYPATLTFANGIVPNTEIARELAMESFSKLWQMRDRIDENFTFGPWLKVTTRNACLNHLLWLERESKRDAGYKYFLEQDPYENSDVKAELVGRIIKEIDSLPSRCRAAFVLKFFQGMRNEEISRAMNISPNTARNQVQRAVNLLKVKLLTLDKNFFLPFILYAAMHK